jgi:hypothetical protein
MSSTTTRPLFKLKLTFHDHCFVEKFRNGLTVLL